MNPNNQTIKLTLTANYHRQLSDIEVILDAVNYTREHLLQLQWSSRPRYDGDAGVFVSGKDYDPLAYTMIFSFFSVSSEIDTLLRLTADETSLLDSLNRDISETGFTPVEIERVFPVIYMSVCAQSIFFYLANIESVYERRARDLYETDNHYTGKPVEFFIEESKKRAHNEMPKILDVAGKLAL